MYSDDEYVQSDLRFLLPIARGQCVGVPGGFPKLIADLKNSGVEVIDPQQISVEMKMEGMTAQAEYSGAVLDHIIIPQIQSESMMTWSSEISRMLKPGGWLYVGVQIPFFNWTRIRLISQKIKRQNHKPHLFLMPPWLADSFPDVLYLKRQCFGVYKDHQHPRYLIPLEHKQAAQHFFARMRIPYSKQGALFLKTAAVMCKMGLQHLLFDNFGFLLQRK